MGHRGQAGGDPGPPDRQGRSHGGGRGDPVLTEPPAGASDPGLAALTEATVGVISDTHGLLRPEAVEALRGCDLIVHAGDVDDPAILDRLAELAPLRAVRGNVDRGPVVGALPLTEAVEVAGATLYVIHILQDLDIEPAAAGVDAVIYGHTHRAAAERRGGVLYLNPGSAGPGHGDADVTVARLRVRHGKLEVRRVDLRPGGPPSR